MDMRKVEAERKLNEIKNTLLVGEQGIQQVADTVGCSYVTAQKWLRKAEEIGVAKSVLKRDGFFMKVKYSLVDPEKTKKELEGKK
jgi:transposase